MLASTRAIVISNITFTCKILSEDEDHTVKRKTDVAHMLGHGTMMVAFDALNLTVFGRDLQCHVTGKRENT